MCVFVDADSEDDDMRHNHYGKKNKAYKASGDTIFKAQNDMLQSTYLCQLSLRVLNYLIIVFFMIWESAKNMFWYLVEEPCVGCGHVGLAVAQLTIPACTPEID